MGIKKVKKEDAEINIQEQSVTATVKFPSGEDDFTFNLDLYRPINVERSQVKVMGTKIDIKLQKLDANRWAALEIDAESKKLKQIKQEQAAKTDAMKYPSSSH